MKDELKRYLEDIHNSILQIEEFKSTTLFPTFRRAWRMTDKRGFIIPTDEM
jgi:hypothetical protein